MRFGLALSTLITYWLPAVLLAQNPTVHYVSAAGRDSNDGSSAAPFRTIQHAIDSAVPGGAVIVLEGRYAGPGNVNLNFQGKAITLQSRKPADPICVRETILDAEGSGVIARFINGEGPGTVFDGFTLRPGDRTALVPGLPGYFEISGSARPTTRHLRVEGAPSSAGPPKAMAMAAQPLAAYSGTPVGGRAWDGNNPFLQPAPTTDYYGSGDVDGDGIVTTADALLAQRMAAGSDPPLSTADVDGNGVVDSADVALINGALSGGTLPAWWNRLTTVAQRNAWVDKVMALDPTDLRIYNLYFQCLDFAFQTHIHGAFYRNDLFGTSYDGGQTWFNIPLYVAMPASQTYGHGINAILVGDDPRNFSDWRFIEPQTDYDVHPGMWDMPYGTQVHIFVPDRITPGGSSYMGDELKVDFAISDTGAWSLTSKSPSLALTRSAPPSVAVDNRPDLWNPRILPLGGGMLLFDRQRADMSRVDDIHITDLPLADPPSAKPLVLDAEYSRLLDVTKAPDGTIYLLWAGGAGYTPGVFCGVIDVVTRTLRNVSRITPTTLLVRNGRVVVTPSGEVNVFWFAEWGAGVYWSKWTGSSWASEQNVGPISAYIGFWGDWHTVDPSRYIFDVTVAGDGTIVLVWYDRDGSSNNVLMERRYSGSWSPPSQIEATGMCGGGVDLATDSGGTVHVAYWSGDMPFSVWSDGNLFHRKLVGSSWSVPEIIDGGGGASCPRLVRGDGSVYLVWQRNTGSQRVPVWRKYSNSAWSTEQVLTVPVGTDAYYPSADVLPDGRLAIAWSSRSADRATIQTAYVGLGCSLSIDTISRFYDSGGGTGSVKVTVPGGCTWSVISNATWLTITSGATGTGSGTVGYSVAADPNGASRTGTLTIAGQTLTVTQAGLGCSLLIDTSSRSYVFGGGTGSVNVTGAGGCIWSAISDAAWLTITSGATGTGSGTVGYSVAANPDGTTRTGTLTIAGQTLTLTQATGVLALRFLPIAPCRVVDTRWPAGRFGGPAIAGNTVRDFEIPAGSCGISSNAIAYSFNVTAVPSGSLLYLSMWPAGEPLPVVSTLNALDGRWTANAAIVPAGASGSVSVFASDATHVVLDINGYFVPAGASGALAFYPLTPCRVIDTRGGASIGAGGNLTVSMRSSTCSVPPSAVAYSLNFTAVPHGPLGWITTWPTGAAMPTASTLNAPTGAITANAAILPAGTNGSVDVYASNATDLLVDINGYFAPPGTGGLSFYTLTPCRVADTRNADGPFGGPALLHTRDFAVSASSCGVPGGAQAYSLNATVWPAGFLNWLTLWPAGGAMPVVSTLNSWDARLVANAAIVPTTNGSISAYASDLTTFLFDINGYFAP